MSTQTQFTPGPWIVQEWIGGPHPLYVRAESRRPGGPALHGSAGGIAKLPASKYHNIQANANLIASAPDMYATLERVRALPKKWRDAGESEDNDDWILGYDAALGQCADELEYAALTGITS